MILLRANAGLPCVFYADLYGSMGQKPHDKENKDTDDNTHSTFIPPTSGGAILPKMILARKHWAYGTQMDYFDDASCVGFTRFGHPSRSNGDGLA